MQVVTHRAYTRMILATAACAALMLAAVDADAKSKIEKTEGKLVSLDAEKLQMTVKSKGKSIVFDVLLEGSVLSRTTATMNAAPAKLQDIPEGAPVIVYWVPDENDKKKRFARKVDAPKVDPEALEQYD